MKTDLSPTGLRLAEAVDALAPFGGSVRDRLRGLAEYQSHFGLGRGEAVAAMLGDLATAA